jgi:hypothetical protein
VEAPATHERIGADQTRAPLARFYRLISAGRAPQRADRAAAGTLPTRAFRFCEAVTSASSFGWYVFPPIGFSLYWEGGSDILWTYEGAPDWYPLKTAQFPGFADRFDAAVPPDVKGFSPPFLGAFTEAGLLQAWSGLVVRTAPGAGTSWYARPPTCPAARATRSTRASSKPTVGSAPCSRTCA